MPDPCPPSTVNCSSAPLPVTVYSPDSQIKNPALLLRQMVADAFAARELAWRLFIRNISAQYRQSFFGYIWAFLPPIVTTGIFVFLNSQKILNIGETPLPYAAYVMVGTLLWQGFVEAINSPLREINRSKAMLAKINFPREALILSGLYEVVFNFSIRLVLLLGVFLWYRIDLSWNLALAPIGIAALLLLGLTIGVGMSPLGVLYEDVGRGVTILTSLWFFLTPVVYPAPTRWPFSLAVDWNPVAPVILTTRAWLTGGEVTHLAGFVLVGALALVVGLAAWLLFRLAMPHLIERMSA